MKNQRFKYFLIICILLNLFVSCNANSGENTEIPFDSSRWKSGDQRLRAHMVNDLLQKNILSGKSESETLDILGPPDEKIPNRFTYFLETKFMGPWRMFLNVDFNDSTKRVTSAWITD